MENPIKKIREELGLSSIKFCIKYKVPSGTLSKVESGNTTLVYKTIIEAFRKAGVSVQLLEQLQDDYNQWLAEKTNLLED